MFSQATIRNFLTEYYLGDRSRSTRWAVHVATTGTAEVHTELRW
jgi:hypothetical protein